MPVLSYINMPNPAGRGGCCRYGNKRSLVILFKAGLVCLLHETERWQDRKAFRPTSPQMRPWRPTMPPPGCNRRMYSHSKLIPVQTTTRVSFLEKENLIMGVPFSPAVTIADRFVFEAILTHTFWVTESMWTCVANLVPCTTRDCVSRGYAVANALYLTLYMRVGRSR